MYNLIRITTVPVSLDKLLEGQLNFMKDYYNVIAISSDITYLKQVGEKEEINTYSVEMTRQITPIKDFIALCKLIKFFRKTKPTIVHTHTPKAGTLGIIAAWITRVPNRLHTVAGLPLLEVTGNKRKLLNLVEKITYKCATKVYPNSQGLKNIVINENFCTSEKLKVLANGSSNGINTAYFDCSIFSLTQTTNLRERLGIRPTDFVFVFIGRIVTDKGINELVAAFNQISKIHKTIKLLLVGPEEQNLDPIEEATREIIKKHKSIIQIGYQPDIRLFFAISNTLVFPSYREGFPNVVMQAGAMGLPSIVTDINGCNEIIIEGENGTIIPPKDTQALKDKMEQFIGDKKYISNLKTNARQMITSRYEQRLVWEAILDEYKSLER